MSSSAHHPFGFSQVPGDPSFRSLALNAVALIPLLSSSPPNTAPSSSASASASGSNDQQREPPTCSSHSLKSFGALWEALGRHSSTTANNVWSNHGKLEDAPSAVGSSSSSFRDRNELVLVVPNSSLTRPGDWRYQETPLKAFHWQFGCQRLQLFDGRLEQHSRLAQDRLLNPSLTRDWIDLCPHRRTAAVIGVLNIRDCLTQDDFDRALLELHHWATQRYATPPYQVTAHGKLGIERDQPVQRLFVFDSFDEECQHIDMSKASILAFPPSEASSHSTHMMDVHVNVVINDLAVAIFRSLEAKIRQSDEVAKIDVVPSSSSNNNNNSSQHAAPPPAQRRVLSRLISATSSSNETSVSEEEPAVDPTVRLSLKSMASLVSPENKLAQDSSYSGSSGDAVTGMGGVGGGIMGGGGGVSGMDVVVVPGRASTAANLRRLSSTQVTPAQLLTPLDDYYEWSTSQLSAKDTEVLKRRDMARREKMAADLSLLAGSPLDAYERYVKAAHMSKSQTDPLWYAMSMVGCAASHICMAEAGGYNVDEYLENNFSLPEDIMAVFAQTGGGAEVVQLLSGKKTFPEVIFALCEEALAVFNRHPRLAAFHAGLLLQLAMYSAESAETHLRCRWGEGLGSYAGEARPYRWEKALQVNVSLLKTKDGRDMIDINVMNRTKIICELLQQAVSVPDLDPATRLDVAMKAALLFLEGIPGTRWKKTHQTRIQLPRKAAFFTVVAAEAMSVLNHTSSGGGGGTAGDSSGTTNAALENLWLLACQLYSRRTNDSFGSSDELGSYAWATLRASTLHALSLQGTGPACLEASEMLLNLLEEIRPKQQHQKAAAAKPRGVGGVATPQSLELSEQHPSGGSVTASSEPETYTSTVTKRFREGFSQATTGASSLLTVQAKWATEAPKPAEHLPLAGDHSLNILALPCVWSSIGYDSCATAQRACAERITTLKKSLCRSSAGEERALSPDVAAEYVAIPISVSPTWSLLSHNHFEIELVPRKRAADAVVEDKGAMATFYNPYEKRGGAQVIPVPAEEERVVTLHMKNWLTVPLSVKECRLKFSGPAQDGRINSAPVSFILPPLVVDYPVQFPFTILSIDCSEPSAKRELEVEGISFTCLNHSYTLALFPSSSSQQSKKEDSAGDVAKPATYARATKKKQPESTSGKNNEVVVARPKIEALPCQPRLSIRYAETTNSLNPSAKLVLGVTNGELVSTPLFELSNARGPKGTGWLERIQVSVLGIPGTSSEKFIYDSAHAGALVGDELKLSEREFMRDLLDDTNTNTTTTTNNPPGVLLKVRMLPGTSLDLDALNSATPENVTMRTLGFQIALAHNFREKVSNPEPEIIFRIRYAGKFTDTKEVWRKFDLPMALSHFVGPRVTSIAFRADLTDTTKILPELLQLLKDRRRTSSSSPNDPAYVSNETALSCRVGLDHSVHVHSDTFVAIVTILNDSSKDIVLFRPDGSPVSSFASTSLPTLKIHRGVQVSIPMSIPRLARSSVGDEVVPDETNELIKATTLSWKTVQAEEKEGRAVSPILAQGTISIKSKKVSDLIARTPSVIPSIFEPPCTIRLNVQGSDVVSKDFSSTAAVGEPIDMAVDVDIASWVSPEIRDLCGITIEFFAACLETSVLSTASSSSTTTTTTTSMLTATTLSSLSSSRDHVWCGLVRRKILVQGMTTTTNDTTATMKAQHAAKVILLRRGRYALSACVHITQGNKGDEIWWAPAVATITVEGPRQ